MTTQAMNLTIQKEAPSLTEAQWNQYYADLHAFLEQHFMSDRFTMFLVTLAAHTKFKHNNRDSYFYVGLKNQRELLKGNLNSIEHLNKPWNYLKNEFGRTSEEIRVTRDVEKAIDPKWDTNSMEDYFNPNLFTLTSEHIAEKAILDHYFRLEDYHYFSISVRWEGQFHTAVHIILSEKDLRKIFVNGLGELNYDNYKKLVSKSKNLLFETYSKKIAPAEIQK